jgi:hypothetical protein
MFMIRRSARVFALLGVTALALALTSLVIRAQAPASDPRGFSQHLTMQQASPFKDLKWQFIGPTNISGRITDIAVAKRKGQTRAVFISTATGGVWRTENEGTTWEPVFDQAASTSIGDVTVAPSDPTSCGSDTGPASSHDAPPAPASSRSTREDLAAHGLTATNTHHHRASHPDIVHSLRRGFQVDQTTRSRRVERRTAGVAEDPGAGTGVIDLVMDPVDPTSLRGELARVRRRWNDRATGRPAAAAC